MPARAVAGFSLVEVVVAMAVIGLLLGGLILPLRTQLDAARYERVREQLRDAENALVGFAIANGNRLPCPDTDADGLPNGPPPPACDSTNVAASLVEGWLPHGTLGLPRDDPWGNRLRYRADPAFTAAAGAPNPPATTASFPRPTLWGNWTAALRPDGVIVANREGTAILRAVMANPASNPAVRDDPYGQIMASGVPVSLTAENPSGPAFIVYSCGKNGIADEANNGDESAAAPANCGQPAIVDDLYTRGVFTDEVFDDELLWVSRYAFVGRLIRAARWPR